VLETGSRGAAGEATIRLGRLEHFYIFIDQPRFCEVDNFYESQPLIWSIELQAQAVVREDELNRRGDRMLIVVVELEAWKGFDFCFDRCQDFVE
jgi:hypothetical protein